MQSFSCSILPQPQAFRLLQILPALNDNDSIRCTIEDIDKEAVPNIFYRALSYTRGDDRARRSISLNRQTAYVTQNLFDAMLHLRMTHSHTNLWIDAKCINQQNPRERTHQVEQMKRIYSEAKEVISWLGPRHDNINRLFFSTEEHVEDHNDSCTPSKCSFLSQEPILVDHQFFDTTLVDALRYLEDRPYWRRVWIVQEVVVAKNVILLSGNNTLTWPALVRFRCLVVEDLQRFIQKQVICKITQSLASWPRDSVGLAQALSYSHTSIATDSRDKVYVVLGLVSRGTGQDLSADYTLAPCTVFCLSVRAMIADWNQDLFACSTATRSRTLILKTVSRRIILIF